MRLSLRTWFTFFVLALLMGLNNVYSTLLTGWGDAGWGDGGSIVAVILCLLLLPSRDANIRNYNLGQTIASAGGSVGFTVAILASLYVWHAQQGEIWEPALFPLALLIAAVALMGVAVAVPIRRYIIHWFFPSAVACATLLKAVTSSNRLERARATRLMTISGLLSDLATLPTKVAFQPGGSALLTHLPLPKGLALSLDPLMYGIGIVIGPRIGLSMLLGAALNALGFIPWLVGQEAEVGEYVRWSAVGLMTLPAFASMIFAVLFRTPKTMPPGFADLQTQPGLTKLQAWGIASVFMAATAVTLFAMQTIFGASWPWVLGSILLGVPMVIALGKVASETNINPVRLLAIVLLFVFSLLGTHSPIALLTIGICGAAMAATAVDLFYDLAPVTWSPPIRAIKSFCNLPAYFRLLLSACTSSMVLPASASVRAKPSPHLALWSGLPWQTLSLLVQHSRTV